MNVQSLYVAPTKPNRRLLQASILNLVAVSIFVFVTGGFITESGSWYAWTQGIVTWLISLILLLATWIGWKLVSKRASLFYAWERLVRLPTAFILLLIGFDLAFQSLGSVARIILVAGFLVGLLSLPPRIRRWRSHLEKAFHSGYLRSSLQREQRSWSLENDNYPAHSDPDISNPGVTRRLMLWIGPAVGVLAVNVLGGPSALFLASLTSTLLGYWLLNVHLEMGCSRYLLMSTLEAELGPLKVVGAD